MALFDSNERAKNGRGGAGRRDSEEVAPGYPVMPITDYFGGGFVRIDGGQLGKRSSHVPALPSDEHEHSVEQASSGARRRTSTVSPFLSGETSFATMHFTWNGKRILFSR